MCRSCQRSCYCSIPPLPHSKAGGNTTAADNSLQINASIANDWGEFLASLNRSLDPLDLELSRIRNEVTGKDMYALVRCSPKPTIIIPHVVNVEHDSRSIVGTMKLLVSRATIRPSRYPTSEHWYVTCHPRLTRRIIIKSFNLSLQVEQIMLAPNSSYSISSLAALHEVNSLTSPMSKTQAESVLASFVTKGWLLKSKLRPPSHLYHRECVPLWN